MPEQAAVREVWEETGVEAQIRSLLAMRFSPADWYAIFRLDYRGVSPGRIKRRTVKRPSLAGRRRWQGTILPRLAGSCCSGSEEEWASWYWILSVPPIGNRGSGIYTAESLSLPVRIFLRNREKRIMIIS